SLPTHDIYTLSLHDALPIFADYNMALKLDPKNAAAYDNRGNARKLKGDADGARADYRKAAELDPRLAKLHPVEKENKTTVVATRSEEHTSELQSRFDLVCRL